MPPRAGNDHQPRGLLLSGATGTRLCISCEREVCGQFLPLPLFTVAKYSLGHLSGALLPADALLPSQRARITYHFIYLLFSATARTIHLDKGGCPFA